MYEDLSRKPEIQSKLTWYERVIVYFNDRNENKQEFTCNPVLQ